jgi:hypothetical protein
MTLRRTVPLAFSPVGCTDALDTTDLPKGAMAQLRNLIPDPTTKNLWGPRPASIELFDFAAASFGSPWSSGFSSAFGPHATSAASFISALKVVGSRAYGLIALPNTGTDFPFCYDITTDALVAITGATAANTPTSPATTGAWTPPTVDVVGTKVVFTHPGFNTINGYFGYIDISNPGALTWTAGNTGVNALPAVPVAVKNFNGRAWYLVNPSTGQPGAYYSDVLAAQTITNATQVLTFDDNIPLTALGGLGVSQTTGGILQALIVFKGVSAMYQVTGDAATPGGSDLARNALNVATGTLAPNAIVPTPKGLAFMSPDGVRLIDFNAQVSDPIGDAGKGVTVPFIFAAQPSRIAATFSADTYRVSVQNGNAAGSPNQDWWIDFSRECWSGPHDFPPSLIQPYQQTFIMTPLGVNAKLFQSDAVTSATSTYVENGTQMTWTWQSSMLPDTDQMSENAMIETTLHMALAQGVPAVNCVALNEAAEVYDTVQISAGGSSSLWDAFDWDTGVWDSGISALSPRQLSWHIPIVFRRLAIQATGQSASAVKVGRLHLRYEQLGFLQQ